VADVGEAGECSAEAGVTGSRAVSSRDSVMPMTVGLQARFHPSVLARLLMFRHNSKPPRGREQG